MGEAFKRLSLKKTRFQTQTLFINASSLKRKTRGLSVQRVLLKFCKIFYVLALMSRQETSSNDFRRGLSGFGFDKEKVGKKKDARDLDEDIGVFWS